LWNNVYYIVTIKHYHVITSDTAEMFTNHTSVAMTVKLWSLKMYGDTYGIKTEFNYKLQW